MMNHKKRRRIFTFLVFICGMLFMSQCVMVAGIAWVSKMRSNSFEFDAQVQEAQAHIRLQKNEQFKKWLIDKGNHKNYMTMEEAWRGFKEFGDEIKLQKDRNNYKQEILRLLKEKKMEI